MSDIGEHIGDGVYVSHDGYQVWLRTSDGLTITNAIALEPGVLLSLAEWARRFYAGHGLNSPLDLREAASPPVQSQGDAK